MPPISIVRAERPDTPTEWKLLAREMSMPDGAMDLAGLAAAIGLEPETVEAWFRDPHFRGFLIQELDARSAITVSLLWRMIGKTALDASRPETRLECAKMYLARFDPGMRGGMIDAARAVEQATDKIVDRAVSALTPKTVLVQGAPRG